MAETLFSATLAVARMIPGNIVIESSATETGSVTTLKDNASWFISPNTVPASDYFNGGTIWFKHMTTLVSEGLTGVITDFASAVPPTASTYTFAPALTVTTVKDDTYAACNAHYPRFILRQAVNAALAEVGGEDLVDVTTTTTADQMTYNLPTGKYNIQRVELATSTSSPYGYMKLSHWREMDDDIYFEEGFQPTSTDYILRLTYRVPFTELTTDAGALPDLVDMNWIKWAGVAYCLRWKLGVTGKDEDIRDFLAESLKEAERMANRYRPKMQQMSRDWPHSAWDIGGRDIDIYVEPGTVRLK
jgi:hypothetical protein